MKNISLIILLLALISQTSFSQNQITSDSEIARDLYEQGLLTSPGVPFPAKKVLAIGSSIVIPGTGQFINGQFGLGSIFLGGAVGSVLLMSVGWGPAFAGFIAYLVIMPWSAVQSGHIASRNAMVFNSAKSKYNGISISPLINLQHNGNNRVTPTVGFSLSF